MLGANTRQVRSLALPRIIRRTVYIETRVGVMMMNRYDWREQRSFLTVLVKWTALGGAVGVLSGIASFLFLRSLEWATATRLAQPELLYGLPLAGLLLGGLYSRWGGVAGRGNNLVIQEVHSNRDPIPRRMAPLILFGTILTHLFGGSVGREGTAVQMGASLADGLRRVFRLTGEDRRWMILAGISGGFGSVFGTPVAGFVFALEAPAFGRIRYEGVVPCMAAAIVGDLVTRTLGVQHARGYVMPDVALNPLLLLAVVLAGCAFGLMAALFVELTDFLKRHSRRLLPSPLLRPLAGGVVVIGLALLLNTREYLGLSGQLITHLFDGTGVPPLAFLGKLVFTAVSLGFGFVGGEVTPLFIMGGTLGFTLGGLLGIDPMFMAALGFVAAFAGASNTPLACTLMGVELFGGGAVFYLALACFVAYLASGHRGIYESQRVGTAKTLREIGYTGLTLGTVSEDRLRWLQVRTSPPDDTPAQPD